MATISKKSLQRMIDSVAKHGAKYHYAEQKLHQFTVKNFGHEAGDIDSDELIDQLFGGCGAPSRISAEDYIKIMLRDIEDAGHDVPSIELKP